MASSVPSFAFGSGFSASTPEDLKRNQAVLQSLLGRMGTPQNLGEGLSAIGNALMARGIIDENAKATEAGRADVAKVLSGIGSADQNGLISAAADPWVAENPGASAVISTLLKRQMDASDPSVQISNEYKRAQIDALKAKPPQQMINAGNGRIFDPNTGTWTNANDAAGGGVGGPQNFDDVSGMRKEVQSLPSYKNFEQAVPIYKGMVETAGRNSRASDLNLVYGLGKIMDPNSVVREGEMVMVKNTASLPDWLVGAINSLNGGAGLTPDTRKAILTEAYGRAKGYQDAFQQDAQQYRGIAGRYKLNIDDIIPNFDEVKPWEPDAAGAGAAKTITNDADYDALPSGTEFIGPDGKKRRKP